MTNSKMAAQGELPRIYRVDERTRQTVNFLIAAVGGLFLTLTVLYLTRMLPYPGSHRGSLGGLVFLDLVMGSILVTIGSCYNKRVILYPDSIEVTGWFYSRKLKFAQIRGRQTTADSGLPYGYSYVLLPSDQSERKLILPHYLHTDAFFREWIISIPKIPK